MTRIVRDKKGVVQVQRFSTFRRIEHIMVIAVFVLLTVTGLPQKYHGDLSVWLVNLFGGLDGTRFVHRVAGLVFTFHAAVHILSFAFGVVLEKVRPSLVPTIQDLRDARGTLHYYMGMRDEPPSLPKFDYRQKFEYMGLILGGLVMIFSGLALMFPQVIAAILPGQVIPVAKEMHTNEAMLALLVLLVWHAYGSHFSPDVYPMDTSVFTGYMPAKNIKHHHAKEYARLFPNGDHEKTVPAGEEKPGEAAASPGPDG